MRKRVVLFLTVGCSFLFMGAGCRSGQPEEKSQTEEPTQEQAPVDFTIEPGKRAGAITASSTEASVKAFYGAGQVQMRAVPIGEGETRPGIALFPGTADELEIVWDIAAATGNPEFIRFSEEGGRWQTTRGIHVGSSLEALEKANGGPFSLYGFGWDYAGLVTGWKGGLLDSHLIVALIPEGPEAIGPEVSGDRLFSSDDPNIRALKLKVGSVVITF